MLKIKRFVGIIIGLSAVLAVSVYAQPAHAESDSARLVFDGSKYVVQFVNQVGLNVSGVTQNSPTGLKLVQSTSGSRVLFNESSEASESLALGAIIDQTGIQIGIHSGASSRANFEFEGGPRVEITNGTFRFADISKAPDGVRLTSLRSITSTDIRDMNAYVSDSPKLLKYISSAYLDLRELKVQYANLRKIGTIISLPSVTTVRQMTFIPVDWVSAPLIGCTIFPGQDFKGDSRTWSPSSSAYRTRFDVAIDWTKGPAVTPSVSIGETSLWWNILGVRTFWTRATAPTSSMVLTRNSYTATKVTFNTTQDVKNPICSELVTRGISFNLNWTISRSGSYSVTGVYMPVPNHEAYVSSSKSSSWVTIYQIPTSDFACLAIFSTCKGSEDGSGNF